MSVSLPKDIQRWKKTFKSYLANLYLLYHRSLGHTSVGPSQGTLSITDSRTGRNYKLQIKNNAIKALDFMQITSAGEGAEVVDHIENGIKILDAGFLNTACVETPITFIDGRRGYVQYREHSIEYLFNNQDYESVIYLLIWGNLPSEGEKIAFRKNIAREMTPPQCVIDVIKSFPPESLTFPMLLAGMSAYTSCDEGTKGLHSSSKAYYLGNEGKTDAAIIRTIAALATTTALVYCHKRGRKFTPACPDEPYLGNILHMMGVTEKDKIKHCFERLWILTADHGMTNSTAAFLNAGSTLTDPMSCIISALVSAYGPLHGAAVEIAYRDFEKVGSVENVPALIADVKAKKFRLFGYGHRIYKVVDPRSKLMRALIKEYSADIESNPFLKVAMEIDRVAGSDEYFTSRNLHANADLYGCFLYTALGFETDMILALACLSRCPGVLAHWRQSMMSTPTLWRPQQIFTGVVAKPSKH